MTANKYHPAGRLYTDHELRERSWALVPTYKHRHPWAGPRVPFNESRNARKRTSRILGFKSLKHRERCFARVTI